MERTIAKQITGVTSPIDVSGFRREKHGTERPVENGTRSAARGREAVLVNVSGCLASCISREVAGSGAASERHVRKTSNPVGVLT